MHAVACIFFNPFFTGVYMVEWLLLQTIYVLNKEILQFLDLKSTVYNQERFIMACVRYINIPPKASIVMDSHGTTCDVGCYGEKGQPGV